MRLLERVGLLAVSLALPVGAGAAEGGATARDGKALGLLADSGAVAAISADSGSSGAPGPWVRLVARWADVERTAGTFDWTALEPEIDRLHASGWRVTMCLTGSNPLHVPDGRPPSPVEGSSVERWIDFVRSAIRTFAGRIGAVEIWDDPAQGPGAAPGFEPSTYAYLLKISAIAARAEAGAKGEPLLIAQGALQSAAMDWQRALWEQDAAAYVDVLPLRLRAADDASERSSSIQRLFEEAVQHPPAPAIWAYVEGEPDAAVAAAIEALGGPARVAMSSAHVEVQSVREQSRVLQGIQRLLGPRFGPAPPGSISFADASGAALSGSRVLGRFVNEEDLSTLVFYTDRDAAGGPGRDALMLLDVPDVRAAQVIDPATGRTILAAVGTVQDGTRRRAAGILLSGHPMALRFQRASSGGVELPSERLQVETERRMTAEEVIASHQEVQTAQDDRLERWIARGRVGFHFKLAQAGSTVDVAIDSTYFWTRGGALEWQQEEYYVNGNRVTWKSIPELPFIQPEKVVTLPLDLTLDRTYVYRLLDDDRVDGRDAYVLTFDPSDAGAPLTLYRGRVWIDKTTFERLRLSVIQTNLEPPVLSNEERDDFTPVAGPDGATFRMLTRTDGQQLWTIAGRNLVVRREVELATFDINPAPEEFEKRRNAAYASNRLMLRETEKGFQYLERKPDGSRELKGIDTSQLFAVAGAYNDESVSSVVPLAGVNWFDYDLLRKNIQVNVFFAGVFAFVNATKPDLFGSRVDGGVEATLFGLKVTDKVFVGDQEAEDQRVRFRGQSISARLGIPLGQFVKMSLVGDLESNAYFRADETAADFVLPRDHRVVTGTVSAEFNRRGYTVSASASASRRSSWAPWGVPDPLTGAFPDYDESQKSFSALRATLFKEWYLPRFQKIRGEVNWLRGSSLDRFSKFTFGTFGDDRLSGFAGSGVRFDRGLVVRSGYAFNLFEVVRFDLSVESARVEETASAGGAQRFTGAGFSGNFIGPWKTVVALSYGRAIASDIPDLVGQQEFLLTILKLF